MDKEKNNTSYDKIVEIEKRCIKIAEVQKEDLKSKFYDKVNNILEKEIDNYRKELEVKQKSELENLDKKNNHILWEYKQNAKIQINEIKEELKQDFFNEVLAEIEKFCKSDKYFDYLMLKINEALSVIDVNQKYDIYMTQSDIEKYSDKLNKCRDIKKLENKYLGGVIVKTNFEIIDNTLYTNLIEKVDELFII